MLEAWKVRYPTYHAEWYQAVGKPRQRKRREARKQAGPKLNGASRALAGTAVGVLHEHS